MAVNGLDEYIQRFSDEEIYKLGLTFFKQNEGKTFHLAYQDKLGLVALTQQAKQGSLAAARLPDLGTLDIIGKERRAAWERLGDLGREEARERFTEQLLELAPSFGDFLAAASVAKVDREEGERRKLVEEEEAAAVGRAREEARQREEAQRRAVQDALNKQTYQQFRSYAEQQYPGIEL